MGPEAVCSAAGLGGGPGPGAASGRPRFGLHPVDRLHGSGPCLLRTRDLAPMRRAPVLGCAAWTRRVTPRIGLEVRGRAHLWARGVAFSREGSRACLLHGT